MLKARGNQLLVMTPTCARNYDSKKAHALNFGVNLVVGMEEITKPLDVNDFSVCNLYVDPWHVNATMRTELFPKYIPQVPFPTPLPTGILLIRVWSDAYYQRLIRISNPDERLQLKQRLLFCFSLVQTQSDVEKLLAGSTAGLDGETITHRALLEQSDRSWGTRVFLLFLIATLPFSLPILLGIMVLYSQTNRLKR